MIYKALFCALAFMSSSHPPEPSTDLKIVTVDGVKQAILRYKTEDFHESEFPIAREIAEKLFATLMPHMPAAGLAAPQIGFNRSIFIYSFDRTPENLEVVINPFFELVDRTQVKEWEACFSAQFKDGSYKIAKLPRYKKIKVSYYNLEGELVKKVLEGFAAKAFQHEYDHLEGIVNIHHKDAVVKSFDTREEFLEYMETVKNKDSNYYSPPIEN